MSSYNFRHIDIMTTSRCLWIIHFLFLGPYAFTNVCSTRWINWKQKLELKTKVRFLYQCSDHLSHSKNFTSLFPLIFLSKHISLYALGRIRWILDIIWPLNQHFKLKNQRNWLNQVWMWKFWNVMNCILLHWYKHLTLHKILNLNLECKESLNQHQKTF